MRSIRFTILALVLLTLSANAFALTQLINLQGKVTDNQGNLVDDGNVTVCIFNATSGGNPIYNSTTNFDGEIKNGMFNVLLGSTTTLDLDYGQQYWLDMEVNTKDVDWSGSERKQFASATGEVTGSAISTLNDTANFRGLDGSPALLNITNPASGDTIWISHSGGMGNVMNISTSTADSAIYIDQGGYTNDGSVYIENTDNSGSALKIYSNKGAASSALLYLEADNSAFDQHVLHVKNDGTGNAIQVDGTINATAFRGNGSALSNMLAVPTKAVNGDFWHWMEGTTTPPTWWNISGSGASVARDTAVNDRAYGWNTGTVTGYSMALTRSTNDAGVFQTWSSSGIRLANPFLGKKLSVSARVNASVASRARIILAAEGGTSPGVANSSWHSGGGKWETLTVSQNIPTDATSIVINLTVAGGDTTAYFTDVQANVGEPQQFVPGNVVMTRIMDDGEIGNNRVLTAAEGGAVTNTETDIDSLALTIPDGAIGFFSEFQTTAAAAGRVANLRGKIGHSYVPTSQPLTTNVANQAILNTIFTPIDSSHIFTHSTNAAMTVYVDLIGWLVWE